MRIIIFWGLCWGPHIPGNYHILMELGPARGDSMRSADARNGGTCKARTPQAVRKLNFRAKMV